LSAARIVHRGNSRMTRSITILLKEQSLRRGNAEAILGLGREPLSFAALHGFVRQVVAELNGMGVRRNHRVAVVLPNGPEMAVCFLAVSCAATCAPLNPAYRADEFEFFFTDLQARALILPRGVDSPAGDVAAALGIPIIGLDLCEGASAGIFGLDTPAGGASRAPEFAEAEDIALVLHTSGTTSRPKIVPLSHSNLLASAGHIAATLRLTPEDRCLNIMPLYHIHGLIGALLATLHAGATIGCAPGFQAPRFFKWLEHFAPTWYTAVPTMHQAILARVEQQIEPRPRCRLRFIRSSSSALAPQVMARLEEVFNAPVIESYGMTEASHQMASNPLPPGVRKPGSVGLPAGPDMAVMGEDGCLLPPEAAGEIVIRGPNVTCGYENNPEANVTAFVDGWFRTGDQGYFDRDGYLFLTGRLKEIINRGGEKISPREIDEALLDHPAVAQAAAFKVPDRQLGEDVAAAVVLQAGASITGAELREFVAGRLADFKVPRRIVFLDKIPEGPTGKPQRIGLAKLLGLDQEEPTELPSDSVDVEPPRTESERQITALFEEVLGMKESPGAQADFFRLGGDSVLAAMLLSRLQGATGVVVSVVQLFENPTVRGLAGLVDGKRSASRPEEYKGIPARPASSDYPVSSAQRRVWFLHQYEQEKSLLNRPAALHLRGELDVGALRRSLDYLISRHEVLRTRFRDRDGELIAVPADPEPIDFRIIDLSGAGETEKQEQLQGQIADHARRHFDLERDLMLRAVLFNLGERDYVLLTTGHHIASDGWSSQVLFEELGRIYAALANQAAPALPALPVQYADFVDWQNKRLEVLTGDLLAYWKSRLQGRLPILELPAKGPRPSRQTYSGARLSTLLPLDLTGRLRRLAEHERCTLFMVLLAGFKSLLMRYTGVEDLIVGTPVAGRIRPETEKLIGLFINSVALRTDLSGAPAFRELLARVKDVVTGALEHQELPFDMLVEALGTERSLSHAPLFQVMFQTRNYPRYDAELAGLEVTEIDVDLQAAEFDLTLETREDADGLRCTLVFNTSLFDADWARRLLGHYQTILEDAARDPTRKIAELSLLTEAERRMILLDWNDTYRETPRVCVHQLFEEQVERAPERTAVIFQGRRLSYRTLNESANRLARYLGRQGVKAGAPVGILINRCPEQLVSILAVMKAGGYYIPLDPEVPAERLAFIVRDAGPVLILTKGEPPPVFLDESCRVIDIEKAPEVAPESSSNPEPSARPEDIVYIMYTSGSTGRPKGVVVQHRGVVDELIGRRRIFPFFDDERALQLASFAFDTTIAETFMPLMSGGVVVMVAPGDPGNVRRLIEVMEQERVTRVHVVPSLLPLLLDEPGFLGLPALRTVIAGSEALSVEVERDFLRSCRAELWNAYGPTETTVSATHWLCRPGDSVTAVPIGPANLNTELYVLDSNMQPVPIGVPGELYIGGSGVARGYWNRPELTEAVFLPHPFSGDPQARLYKTGDLVRYRSDGAVEFLGRIDDQVQIRGYRVEPGEIQNVLLQHPGVRQAVVVPRKRRSGDLFLTAYVVSDPDHHVPEDELRRHLAAHLPRYMIPASIVSLSDLPLNPNGKVDRGALPEPDEVEPRCELGESAAVSDTEQRLSAIWKELLEVSPRDIRQSFFDLGGHSLLAVRLLRRIEKEFDRRLPLASLFEADTIEGQARLLEEGLQAPRWSALVAIRSEGSRPPLFLLHGNSGNVLFYKDLADLLGEDQPVYGVQAIGGDGRSQPLTRVEDMAEYYLREVREVFPSGPYCFAGFCIGAYIAQEMARRVQEQGAEVAFLASLNTDGDWRTVRSFGDDLGYHLRSVSQLQWAERLRYPFDRMARRWAVARKRRLIRRAVATVEQGSAEKGKEGALPLNLLGDYIEVLLTEANRRFCPRPCKGRLIHIQAERDSGHHPNRFWARIVEQGVERHVVPGRGAQIFEQPHVLDLARCLRAALDRALRGPGSAP
jgi:amino acid adenylation domain-containing protein